MLNAEHTLFFFFEHTLWSHSPASTETNAKEWDKEVVRRAGIIFHGGCWGLGDSDCRKEIYGKCPSIYTSWWVMRKEAGYSRGGNWASA